MKTGSVNWIDPDCLVQDCHASECLICCGIMVKPVSGCPEGHCLCKTCYEEAIEFSDRCPTCRWSPVKTETLVPNRIAEQMINDSAIRCEKTPDAGPPPTKRARFAPTIQTLRETLAKRGLSSKGLKTDLVARIEFDQTQVCKWEGSVYDFTGHRAICARATVQCSFQGCLDTPLRTGLAIHQRTCGVKIFECVCGKTFRANGSPNMSRVVPRCRSNVGMRGAARSIQGGLWTLTVHCVRTS